MLSLLLSCGSPIDHAPSMVAALPADRAGSAKVIHVSSVGDFETARADINAASQHSPAPESVVVVISAGVYDRPLPLQTDALSEPIDLTVRGDGEVWFEDAGISVRGHDVTVTGLGFRGRVLQGSMVEVTASGSVTVSDVRIQDAFLGQPYNGGIGGRSPSPEKPPRQGRGKRPKPSYGIAIHTSGLEPVTVKDVSAQRVKVHTDALVHVSARPRVEVRLETLTASDCSPVEPISVSDGVQVIRP